MSKVTYRCSNCGGKNVQESLRAWFDPNKGLALVDIDVDSTNDTWCEDCQEHYPLIQEKTS